jgi:hypothetical protein
LTVATRRKRVLAVVSAMRRSLAHFLPASVFFLVACGGGEERPERAQSPAPPAPSASPAPAAETIALPLGEQNRSGRSGTATLRGGNRGFTVTLALRRPQHSGPAHIHTVSCEQYRAMKDFDAQYATVERNLRDLVDGRSRTRLDEPLSQYRVGGYSINVHSYAGEFPVVACGDIP